MTPAERRAYVLSLTDFECRLAITWLVSEPEAGGVLEGALEAVQVERDRAGES